jgi:hypothetical protein
LNLPRGRAGVYEDLAENDDASAPGPKEWRPKMKKFLVLYLVPPSVIEDWGKTDPDVRKAAEEKMRGEWNAWMAGHAKMITDTGAGGKTKLVSTSGVSDSKNDIMLYSFVEAESHEAAATAFEHHPHLQIPQSSIEVMEVRSMTGA